MTTTESAEDEQKQLKKLIHACRILYSDSMSVHQGIHLSCTYTCMFDDLNRKKHPKKH